MPTPAVSLNKQKSAAKKKISRPSPSPRSRTMAEKPTQQCPPQRRNHYLSSFTMRVWPISAAFFGVQKSVHLRLANFAANILHRQNADKGKIFSQHTHQHYGGTNKVWNMNIHRCCILIVSRKFVDVLCLFVVAFLLLISLSFLFSISDKPQMQTDTKITKFP